MTIVLPPESPALGDARVSPSDRRRRLGHDRTFVIGFVIVAGIAATAVLAPLLAPHDPNAVDIGRRFRPPSATFPLGTDELGRDILSRLIFGARLCLGATLVAGIGISVIGLTVGLLSGYLGGLTDTLMGRMIDSLLAFPSFLLALALTALLGPGLLQVTIAVLAVGWVGYARVVRAMAISGRSSPHIEASRALGASWVDVLRRHLVLDVAGPAVVLTTLEMSGILLAISALSYLGLGVQPPAAEWGAMLAAASGHLGRAPYMVVAPGAAILVLALGFNLMGDGLRDVLDPQAGSRRL